ncbi:DUF4192 domain-containing protein [Paenarthrobacter sp. PH39-S1]|uniref:DUF4192 domain-containing protein n=1 Tax=Paenarthrobacter sp. PH39-S1 TaxID=3046204 RepID=UPI0024BB4C5C|nr:DUF4192 domain-containing protein [Paenarthrobacter sp. PH39-S1]MDJ0356320.1 DUF4192 domain-containing protein [Paenarthrobacter sp. PH39-S1]
MERLSIKTPDDFISLMGHTLGYWPKESLVCVTLDDRRIGATLRVDLPSPKSNPAGFVDDVVKYVSSDREATGIVFGIFTHADWAPGEDRPYEAMMERLAGELSARNIRLRDGWIIGEKSFANYIRMGSDSFLTHPIDRITSSELNAELVFRGSSIEASPDFRMPVIAQRDVSEDVIKHCRRIEAMSPPVAVANARKLWSNLLQNTDLPTDGQAAELLANFKFISVRDRLLADIPGLDDTMGDLLLAQTKRAPHWRRVDRATELLLHLYTRADGADAAPVLTSLGIIQWWEGKGSRAHQCFQHALEADPNYRLAQLSDQMVGAGILAPWAMDRNAAYQPRMSHGPRIEGMGMA